MSTPPSPCPSWCTTDHQAPDADTLHRTTHMAAANALWLPSGLVTTRAWWSGYDHTDPAVFITLPTADGILTDPKSAYGLAVLLEMLADATPDQHRQIAAHARSAADALMNGGTS